MKRFLLVCAAFPLILSAAFTGHWRTTADIVTSSSNPNQRIGVYVTLTQTGGQIAGTAATVGTLKPIQNVVVSGSQISFSVAEGAGTTKFVLTDAAGKLSGTVTLAAGQVIPVTLDSIK